MKRDVEKPSNLAESKPKSLGSRHLQAVMLCLAMMLAYAMRSNMSMAIVDMTDSSKEGSFLWSMQIQSLILSSFFWGYVLVQIPGGLIAARFGGKILFIISIGCNALISLIMPIGSYYGGWKLVCIFRISQGMTQGFLFPSTHNLIGKWIPLEEKSRLGSLIYAGSQVGTAVQYLSGGFIADSLGWPAMFYTTGILGLIWTAVYIFFGADSPQNARFISDAEKMYIQHSLGDSGERKNLKTPWMSIFTSIPFYALIIAQNWGFWTLVTLTPSYMSQVLGVDIKKNGVLSALPYIAVFLMSFPAGFTADYILAKKCLRVTATRKLFNSIGLYGPAIALIGLSYSPAGNVSAAVTILTLVVALNAGTYPGYLLVHIDMSPNYAGTLMGITNFFANIVALIAPLAAGVLLQDETNSDDWRKVFYVASAIYITSNTLFVIFGSCEKQKWNEIIKKSDGKRKTIE